MQKERINKFYSLLEGHFGSKEVEELRQKMSVDGDNITITYRNNNYDFSLDNPENTAKTVAKWWDKHLMGTSLF